MPLLLRSSPEGAIAYVEAGSANPRRQKTILKDQNHKVLAIAQAARDLTSL